MPSYDKLLPCIQVDDYCCWAASMSWWLKAKSDRGRPQMKQEEIMNKFPQNWDKNGAMTFQGMVTVFNEPKFMMKYRMSDGKDLNRIIVKLSEDPVKAIDAFPIFIGYYDKAAQGNHAAVLCQFTLADSYQKFITMDPAVGYRTREKSYFESAMMVYAWGSEADYFF